MLTCNAKTTPSACENRFVTHSMYMHVSATDVLAVPTFLFSQIQHSPETILLM